MAPELKIIAAVPLRPKDIFAFIVTAEEEETIIGTSTISLATVKSEEMVTEPPPTESCKSPRSTEVDAVSAKPAISTLSPVSGLSAPGVPGDMPPKVAPSSIGPACTAIKPAGSITRSISMLPDTFISNLSVGVCRLVRRTLYTPAFVIGENVATEGPSVMFPFSSS